MLGGGTVPITLSTSHSFHHIRYADSYRKTNQRPSELVPSFIFIAYFRRATNYVEFLSNFTCRAPLFPNDKSKLVTITDHNTVGEAFKKMIDNHITSIPVLHHATKNPLYVISLMHFAQYLVSTYKKSDFVDSFWNYLLSIFKDNSSQFLRTTIDELQQNTFYTLDPAFVLEDQETLLKAVELMVRSQTHRVLVVNNIGDVVNVITQSRILELLGSIIDCLPNNTKTIEVRFGSGYD